VSLARCRIFLNKKELSIINFEVVAAGRVRRHSWNIEATAQMGTYFNEINANCLSFRKTWDPHNFLKSNNDSLSLTVLPTKFIGA
jgi:hypothetical protein